MAPALKSPTASLDIAVIGTGISGLSAAWLLGPAHRVTVYEAEGRLGGHSHTVEAGGVPVDTGFIVYNEHTYPNLTALFDHLEVPTKASNMSFAVSLDGGRREYAASDVTGLKARKRDLFSPRFWSMLYDLVRFYRRAATDISPHDAELISLGDYLDAQGYGRAFQDDHLLPQAAAIWSASPDAIRDYPACAFVRFFENHGLLKFANRPRWRTVEGGSRAYVERLSSSFRDRVRLNSAVQSVRRTPAGVFVRDAQGRTDRYDHVVIATHADQALRMLDDPSVDERTLLGAFRYTRNLAVLHTDPAFMPRRERLWASWNYVGKAQASDRCSVTYWMNRLQGLETPEPLFVTLNPHQPPSPDRVIRAEVYEHPLFDAPAIRAQRRLWSLQGERNTWFCGAHFGSGFHEDGLQAGLAVAEQLGGVRRPWTVAEPSGRITVTAPRPEEAAA